MKKLLLLPLLLSLFVADAQTTAIPDPNFEQALINIGLDVIPIDGVIPTANIDTLTILIVAAQGLSDLTGIEDFTSLTYLNCGYNPLLLNINVTQNTALTELWSTYGQLMVN